MIHIYTNLQSVLQFITFKQFIHQNQNSKIQKSNFVTEGPGWKKCFLTQIHKLLWLAKTTGKSIIIGKVWSFIIIHLIIIFWVNLTADYMHSTSCGHDNKTGRAITAYTAPKPKTRNCSTQKLHHGTYHSRKLHRKRHKIQTAPFSASSASQNACFACWTRLGLRSRSMPVMARALATASE